MIVIQVGIILISSQLTGVSSCNWRICPKGYLASISCISGVLLYCPAWQHQWGHASRDDRCSCMISPPLENFWGNWYLIKGFFTPKATLPYSLSCSYLVIWSTQRPLFIYHRVKAHCSWSNCYEALGQMLLTNQQLDKLAAFFVDFANCGMLEGTCLSDVLNLIGRSFTLVLLFQIIRVL